MGPGGAAVRNRRTFLLPVLLRHGLPDVRPRDAIVFAFFGGLGFALCAYVGFASAPASHGAVLLHGTLPFRPACSRGRSPVAPRDREARDTDHRVGHSGHGERERRPPSPKQLAGDCALLLASFSWSAYGLLARRLGLPPAHSASIVAVMSMCAYLPFFLLARIGVPSVGWGELLSQAVFQGLLIGAVSIFVYSKAVALLGATRIALLTAAVPCVTTVAAGFLLHEIPSALALSGVGLVTAGMIMSCAPRSARERRQDAS